MTAQLGLAARAALVAGLAFGLREGLEAVDHNAFAFASQYVWLYAVVPIQFWVLLALALVLPWALLIAAVDADAGAGRGLWRYAALLGAAGAASFVIPLVGQTEARLEQVGAVVGAVKVLLAALAASVALLAAVILAAAAAWYEGRTARPLRNLAAVSLAICLLGLVPVANFLATERGSGAAGVAEVASLADAAAPNLLLISIDTLRADALARAGADGARTPNLDRLARAGARFEQAISPSSWTLPAMASLFTGLHVRRHNAGWVTTPSDPLGRAPLSPDVWTLTTALRRDGYATAAVVTNPYLAPRYGFAHGFDTYENLSIRAEIVVAFQHTALVRTLAWLWPALLPGDRSGTVTERAVEWLQRRPADRPFYLWVHFIDPHAPYVPGVGARVNSFRGDSLLGGTGGGDFVDAPPDIARLRSGEVRPDAQQKAELRRLYDGEVEEVDAAVGALLDELDRLGLTASTFVVLVSDHGEEFWEHGGVEHGRTVYDEVVRVPLLLRWPGHIPAGTTVGAPVGLTDIAPTVMDLLGRPLPDDVDGRSVRRAVEGGEPPPTTVLIESMHFAEERVGLRTATHKYVRWANGKEEVYDLIVDPMEQVDLAGVLSVIAPLRASLDRIDARVPRRAPPAAVHPTGATREALRALGYTD